MAGEVTSRLERDHAVGFCEGVAEVGFCGHEGREGGCHCGDCEVEGSDGMLGV